MQSIGFQYLYVGGNQSGVVMGIPEPFETVTLMADIGRTVARACREEMPVILDASAGFGEPVHVMYTVEALEAAGVTAIHIEDQFFPKRVSYHRGLEHVVPIDVYQQRIEYALKARKSKDFLIIGRTDGARATADAWLPQGGSRDEAVRRARAAMELGVDALMILGKFSRDDFKYLRGQVKDIPLAGLVSSHAHTALGVNDFKDLGYQIILFNRATIVASLNTVNGLYRHLIREGRPPRPESAEREALENSTAAALISN